MNYRSIVGFLELYSATGASHYLDSSKAIVDWFLKRVYRGGGTHLDRFFPDKKAFGWPRSHILDEGSFVTLHDLTREDRYAGIFRDQVDGLISSIEPEGTFSCMHTPRMETEGEAGPNEIPSRGMYWHLIPMLMVQLKRSSARTMDALNSGVALMRDLQDPEGFLSRTYPLERGAEAHSEPDGAATAMFAFIWMKMHEVSGEEAYGQSAEKALLWMLKSQFVVRREVDAFGAFFQERKLHEGRPASYLGGLASIYGILACEEYLRLHGER
jgi:rhamnogalacturonyl hydrolase YesR